tara:strand:+ start:102 stop:539 length:438 start_codon:yes stop_codon:yes gene_type:complete
MKKILSFIFFCCVFTQPDLDKVIQYAKDSLNTDELSNFGVMIAQDGYCVEAISIFKEVTLRDSLRDKAYNNIGNCYYDLKYPDVALEYYLKAIEINPDNEQSLQSIGSYYYNINELDIALKYWKQSAILGNTIIQDWLSNHGYKW